LLSSPSNETLTTGDAMKKIIIALSITFSFTLPTYAFADQAACEAKAVSKDGKPLYGAAKTASIKKCEAGK